MTTTPRARRVRTLVAVLVALALTLLDARRRRRPAPPTSVPKAQHRILGSAPDQPPHPRGDLDRGLLPLPVAACASTATCAPSGSTGCGSPRSAATAATAGVPTVDGKLWSPHQPGRPVRRTVRRRPSAAAAQGDLCLQGTTACAAPWNWFASYVDTRQHELVRRFVDPCATGSLEGGGVVAATDLSARILFEGGVLTAARAGSAFAGPPGIALGALSGCMVGEGAGGLHTVKALVDKLNPFDRGARPRG